MFGRAAGALVVGEVAVAVLLVVGAGLLIRSFAELVRVDPGFRTERIVTARITPGEARYGDDARLRTFYGELLARVGALPGVQRVEVASHLPLVGGAGGLAFEVEGKPYVQGTGAPVTGERRITPGYPRRVDVLRMVLRQALLLAGAGTALGLGAAFAMTRVLESLLFGVSANDVSTFAAAPILLLAVALVAAYVPASRATRVDPTIALRLE